MPSGVRRANIHGMSPSPTPLSVTQLAAQLGADAGARPIAFLLIGEAQHVAHCAPVAFALATADAGLRPWFLVTDPALAPVITRIAGCYPGGASVPVAVLPAPGWMQLLAAATHRRRSYKAIALFQYRRLLQRFDAIVVAERTSTILRRFGVDHPRLIHIPHGAGDRKQGFDPRIRHFDLTIVGGRKDATRMLDLGLIRAGHYAVSGYIKRDLVKRLARAQRPLFDNRRPTVLYNPHFDRKLSSWFVHGRELIRQFAEQDRFNLVVAPHVRLFADASARARQRWQALALADRILIDLGSERSIDASYTTGADIYLGDVSSQVYEFLMQPRPCVFLNSFAVDWADDPNYAHWRLGEVIERPQQALEALARAPALWQQFRPLQEAAVLAALGPDDGHAPQRAAAAIIEFLARGQVSAG